MYHKFIKMSIAQFKSLTEEEKLFLLTTPAMVTYLIGGADGVFDPREEVQAEHIVRIRKENGDPLLFDFYIEVEKLFFEQLDALVNNHSAKSAKERTEFLVAELSKLNQILPKLDNLYARALLASLRSLAKFIAESSGGVFGFLEISYEEEQLLGLTMVTYTP